MLFLHLLIPSPALQELPALIVYPEGIDKQLIDLADFLLRRLLIEHAARLERRLLVSLVARRLRQPRAHFLLYDRQNRLQR